MSKVFDFGKAKENKDKENLQLTKETNMVKSVLYDELESLMSYSNIEFDKQVDIPKSNIKLDYLVKEGSCGILILNEKEIEYMMNEIEGLSILNIVEDIIILAIDSYTTVVELRKASICAIAKCLNGTGLY